MQILEDPANVRLALIFLRVLYGWNQSELADRAGINKSLISLYELEKQAPSGKTFSRLLSAFHIPVSAFETVLNFVRIVRNLAKGSEDEVTDLVTTVAGLMNTATKISLSQSLAGMLTPRQEALPEDLSAEASEMEERFRRSTLSAQKAMAADLREYHTWSFCEWLCQEVEGSLETDVAEAQRLAELAVDVAARVPAGRTPRRRLQGYAWAHLARARQAAGDLPGTEEAVTRARELWEACNPDDPDIGLAERFLDLVTG